MKLKKKQKSKYKQQKWQNKVWVKGNKIIAKYKRINEKLGKRTKEHKDSNGKEREK